MGGVPLYAEILTRVASLNLRNNKKTCSKFCFRRKLTQYPSIPEICVITHIPRVLMFFTVAEVLDLGTAIMDRGYIFPNIGKICAATQLP